MSRCGAHDACREAAHQELTSCGLLGPAFGCSFVRTDLCPHETASSGRGRRRGTGTRRRPAVDELTRRPSRHSAEAQGRSTSGSDRFSTRAAAKAGVASTSEDGPADEYEYEA